MSQSHPIIRYLVSKINLPGPEWTYTNLRKPSYFYQDDILEYIVLNGTYLKKKQKFILETSKQHNVT